ncbi:hypothetical protein [Burkholderia ubonensis]|uniref:hypothetical protein n=1 Tax=Burkholderia ubonensis TaxID=101571 RepID=UPI00116032AD|nr:hypothetical protein [Burkholderia ubonensis]
MTKEMLLPLSAGVAQQKSLRHHLALASLQTGNGSTDAIGKLFHAIYVAYFVHEATVRRRDLDVFRIAEAALHESAARGKASDVWEISDDGRAAIERVLLMHDQQLTNAPVHVISSAQERLDRFLTTDELSPIAGA